MTDIRQDTQTTRPAPPAGAGDLLQRSLPLAALLLAAAGGFLPWVYREAVALQLTAPGLAEFVKFLPEVRRGELALSRLAFLLPLFAGALSLPLLAVNRQLRYRRGWQWLLRLAVLPPALALLPPVWTPGILVAAEFRWQTLAAILCLGIGAVAPLLKNAPLRWLALASCLLALAGAGLAFQQFYRAQAALAEVYHSPVAPGWGAWLIWAGAGWLALGSLAAWLTPRPPIRGD